MNLDNLTREEAIALLKEHYVSSKIDHYWMKTGEYYSYYQDDEGITILSDSPEWGNLFLEYKETGRVLHDWESAA